MAGAWREGAGAETAVQTQAGEWRRCIRALAGSALTRWREQRSLFPAAAAIFLPLFSTDVPQCINLYNACSYTAESKLNGQRQVKVEV